MKGEIVMKIWFFLFEDKFINFVNYILIKLKVLMKFKILKYKEGK